MERHVTLLKQKSRWNIIAAAHVAYADVQGMLAFLTDARIRQLNDDVLCNF